MNETNHCDVENEVKDIVFFFCFAVRTFALDADADDDCDDLWDCLIQTQ